METCDNCGKPCNDVGKPNKLGIRKEYCCECYSKMDANYISELWCETCTNRLIDPHHEARTCERNKVIQAEENFFKR